MNAAQTDCQNKIIKKINSIQKDIFQMIRLNTFIKNDQNVEDEFKILSLDQAKRPPTPSPFAGVPLASFSTLTHLFATTKSICGRITASLCRESGGESRTRTNPETRVQGKLSSG